MANPTADTPFLSDNEHDESSYHPISSVPANTHFKRSLKLISVLTSFLSLGVFGLLIAAFVLTKTGPFTSTWSTEDAVRDLAIALFITFLVTTPTIFLDIPILLNIASNLAMSITLFIIAPQIFDQGWPGSEFCTRWRNVPPYGRLPAEHTCEVARDRLRIMIGVAGGLGLAIGVVLITALLLRLVALARTKFWVGKGKGFNPFKGWNQTGFTVQFTLSVLPSNTVVAVGGQTAGSQEQERLIET